MGSRQYVAHSATGCSGKGKTIAKYFGDGLFLWILTDKTGACAQ
jgi:hypothetical protein